MEDLLKSYLTSIGMIDFLNMLTEAFVVFDEAERDYEIVFEEILHTADQGDSGEDIDRMRYYVDSTIRDICAGYNVYLADDLKLTDMVQIARGLQTIEDYEDKAEMKRIFESDMDEHERTAMLLNLVTPFREDSLMDMITEGNLSFMSDKIVVPIEDNTPLDVEVKAKERIVKFMNFTMAKRKPVAVLIAIKNGFPLGLPITVYINALEQIDMGGDLENVAYNLLGSCLASDIGGESAIVVCKPYYELFGHTMEETTMLNAILIELAKEFTSYGQI